MSTTQTTSRPTGDVQRFRVMLTIVGAVCSAVVTALLAAEGASLTSRLVGTAFGAAIPPLIGATRPGHEIGVTVAVLVTAAAVVLGYGGDQLVSGVTDKDPSLPSPNEIVQTITEPSVQPPVEPPAEPSEEPGDDELVMTEGPLEITVSPGAITCEADGSCDTVTVTSTGTATLHVTWLEFEGDAASYLTATDCEDTLLEPGQSCTITPTFSPADAPETVETRLVIHQNFQGPATYVPLTAAGGQQPVPNLSLGQAFCDLSGLIENPDTGTVTGQLVVEAPVSAVDLAEGILVEAIVHVDGSPQWPAEVAGDRVVVQEFYEGPRPTEILVEVDPAQRVHESNEGDNVAACA